MTSDPSCAKIAKGRSTNPSKTPDNTPTIINVETIIFCFRTDFFSRYQRKGSSPSAGPDDASRKRLDILQAEIADLRIPLDKEGADIMYSVIAPEPKFQAQLIYQAAVIMHVAGVKLDHAVGAGLGQQRYGHVHRRQ